MSVCLTTSVFLWLVRFRVKYQRTRSYVELSLWWLENSTMLACCLFHDAFFAPVDVCANNPQMDWSTNKPVNQTTEETTNIDLPANGPTRCVSLASLEQTGRLPRASPSVPGAPLMTSSSLFPQHPFLWFSCNDDRRLALPQSRLQQHLFCCTMVMSTIESMQQEQQKHHQSQFLASSKDSMMSYSKVLMILVTIFCFVSPVSPASTSVAMVRSRANTKNLLL